MKILAIEFSSEQRTAAVVESGGSGPAALLGRAVETGTHRPLALAAEALRQAGCEREEIEVLAVGLGPGSYTGIRGAIALAQGWQLGRGVKVIGVSSVEGLAAAAQEAKWTGPLDIIIDAQRNEFYLARYEIGAGSRRELEALRLARFAEIEELARGGATLCGPGATQWFAGARELQPDAGVLGRLAAERRDYTSGEKLEPIYLRETAFKKAPPRRVTT
jgi:tRNA threonylcarbamoyladenosine biosynthesis protein TsaB